MTATPARKAIEVLLKYLVVGKRVRPRTNYRHVTQENVDELRQLVQARAPQEPSKPRDARIVAPGLIYCGAVLGDQHRAELEYLEDAIVLAITALAKEHRPR